jgi:hypothetical protein
MFFAREEANTVPDAEHGMFPTRPIGGGEMGALIHAFDWTQTPLGPIEGWPQSLRLALAICLGSSSAIGIYWGRDLTLLYNDAFLYSPQFSYALARKLIVDSSDPVRL